MPMHKAVAINGTTEAPSVETNDKIRDIRRANIIGVSMIARLIIENEKILPYVSRFIPKLLHAFLEKIARPIAGPIEPIPIQRPLERYFILSEMSDIEPVCVII